MKKIFILKSALLISLFFSSISFADHLGLESVKKILRVQPVLDQELIVGHPENFIPLIDDGTYRYYKYGSSATNKIRTRRKSDRFEMEVMYKNGKWGMAQTHFKKSRIIANYIKGKLLGYTRNLEGGIIAHYKNKDLAEADKKGEKADTYTRFVEDDFYASYSDTLEQAQKGFAALRIFSDGDRYQVEAINSRGKRRVMIIINPKDKIITRYKDRVIHSKHKLKPNGTLEPYYDW